MSSKVKFNWPEVETAFERNAPGLRSYIERKSGNVMAFIDGDPQDADLAARISRSPSEYLRIEPASSQEQYRWMEQFVALLEHDELRDQLMVAIDGKGAFRRFKDVLVGYPVEREQWFNYRGELLHHYINKWLETKEIDPDPAPPWGEIEAPPEPAKPIVRNAAAGENPADVLRKQINGLVDSLPAGELHAARVFLEYLRDRGSMEFNAGRGKVDLRRPVRRAIDPSDSEEGGRESSEEREAEPELKLAGKAGN